MCKYCKFTDVSKHGEVVEKTMDRTLCKSRDGSRLTEVVLYRSQIGDKLHAKLEIFETCDGNAINIKKPGIIDIKYCPFCGEEIG